MKLPIDQIKPNPDNPRLIKDQDFKDLVKSLKDFPEMTEAREVVVNKDMMILGGNMRYNAAIELGWTEIEVKVVDWPEAKQREFIIKDNIQKGEHDWDKLANEWDTDLLADWGLDLPNGFGDEEVEEDEAPELSTEPALSKLGEVYQLGVHRVMCGSATELGDVSELMNGALADLLHTDPPYNVDYTGRTKDALKIENDSKSNTEFRQFLVDAFTNAVLVMKEGASFYIFHADLEGYNFRGGAYDAGLQVRQCLMWVKNSMVMGRQDYQWQHEPILYGWKDGAGHSWYTDRKQTTVLNFERPTRSTEHPTMKPINICAYLVGNSSKKGDIVLDLFGGSGSTLIACEQLDRTCYMMELDPKYVDVIRKRYAKYVYPDRWESTWQELTPKITG